MRLIHACFIGMCVAAAGCAADAGADDASLPPLPVAGRDIVLRSESILVTARVGAGATLASILHAQDVASDEAARLVSSAAAVFDLRRIRVDQPYRLEKALSGFVKRFEYEIDGDRYLRIVRAPDATLDANLLPIPKTRALDHVSGRLDRDHVSLVASLETAGETIDLALRLAEILGGEIDFSNGVQPGDRFDVIVEKQFRDGDTFAGYGTIEAVEFVNAGRVVRAVRFAPDGGAAAYYDERGMSMKRFFLASPLKFQPVVTSGFTRDRLHPVLGVHRAHLGVDYRAPAGAPVVAVADGIVVSAGMAGGSGRLVHLRHANGFESEYLHLSSIAVRRGQRVEQGEMIGRVGASGLATGPHLDYRLKKNGVFINPVAAHRAMPPGQPVAASQMTAFATVRDRWFGTGASASLASVADRNSTVR